MLDISEQKESNLIDVEEFNKRFKVWTEKHSETIAKLEKMGAENKVSWGSFVEENAQKYPDKPAIKFEDTTITYKEFNELVNKYANYFLSIGLKKGDIAKVLIKNRIEFLLIYTANAKIGVISSLINTDLRKKTLIHCMNITSGKIVIIGEECFKAFNDVRTSLNLSDAQQLCFIHDFNEIDLPEGFVDLPQTVNNFPVNDPLSTDEIMTSDVLAYIFTSGTTGLPKAALLTHSRVLIPGLIIAHLLAEFTSNDTMYIPLPFFHGTAIMTGWSSILVVGGTLALSRKFSASHFWEDIRKFNATAFNYVGEVCRYLMNNPPTPEDSKNNVSTVVGNGLRPEIWKNFKKRFDIPTIGEFYGSSEGNVAFMNVLNFDNTTGYSNYPYAIVRYDPEEDKPIRNKRGFMRKVRRGEVGLLIGKSEGDTTFIGYTDKNATEAKLFHNVFKEGDAWYNSGDLMRDQGCYHAQFVDRLGDTFRWKGHNVSTTEVEQILNVFDEISMSSVYGVKIPLTDGRAGMAAIVTNSTVNDFNFNNLITLLNENLAPYAIPIFLRFKTNLSTTHSFKFKKIKLKNEGFDIEKIDDPLFIMLPNQSVYKPLTREIYKKILNKEYKF
ncbi:MAG: long-chain-acyl-CoA synthetase [Promethearchaeota archaeon]|jgi:citronellyl-CoA synthetase